MMSMPMMPPNFMGASADAQSLNTPFAQYMNLPMF